MFLFCSPEGGSFVFRRHLISLPWQDIDFFEKKSSVMCSHESRKGLSINQSGASLRAVDVAA